MKSFKFNILYILIAAIFILFGFVITFNLDIASLYKFISSLIIVFYIPGNIILRTFKFKISAITRLSISLVLGLFISSEIFRISFYLNIQKYLWPLYVILAGFYCILNINKIKEKISKKVELDRYYIFLISLCFVVIFLTWWIIFPSGEIYSNGMRFYQMNSYDLVSHWAFSEELARPLPRQMPFWTGVPMVGYYMGAFYWKGLLGFLTHIEPLKLYLRLCPIFTIILAVLTLFSIIKEIKNRKVAVLSVLSVFFIGNLSWIFPVLDRILFFTNIQTINFDGNIIRYLMLNPALIYGMLAMLMGLFFLKEAKEMKSFPVILFSGYFFGALFSAKAFFGIVFMASLFLLSCYEITKEKKLVIFKIFSISVIFSIIGMYETFTKSSGSVLKFNPFYFPARMASEAGFTKYIDSNILGQIGFVKIFIALGIYTIGNIGIKLPAFFIVGRYIKNWRLTVNCDKLLIISLPISFMLTHMLTLSTIYIGATLNFYYLFLIILSIYFSEWLTEFLKNKTMFKRNFIICSVVLFALGSTYFAFLEFTPKYAKYKLVTYEELEALDFIRHNTEKNAIIIHNRKAHDWYLQSTHKKSGEGPKSMECFISALGGRRVVLECSWHVACTGIIDNFEGALKERENDIKILFSTNDRKKAIDVLNKYGVSYIWVDKNEDLNFHKTNIVKKVFSNEDVIIYKVL